MPSSSSAQGFLSTSNHLRDWTGYLSQGDRIGDRGGTGEVFKADWKNLPLPPARKAPAVVIKVPNSEFLYDLTKAKKVSILLH